MVGIKNSTSGAKVVHFRAFQINHARAKARALAQQDEDSRFFELFSKLFERTEGCFIPEDEERLDGPVDQK